MSKCNGCDMTAKRGGSQNSFLVPPPIPATPQTPPPPAIQTQEFCNDFVTAGVISSSTLLAVNGSGSTIHSVDIDVRKTSNGIPLIRGASSSTLFQGRSESWSGLQDGQIFEAITDFSMTLSVGDEVVISWTEII